jgi:O-antigen/teichoic acid export membrane protein
MMPLKLGRAVEGRIHERQSLGAMKNGASPFARIFNHLILFGFRVFATVAKFLLTLYIARYLGLADLGIYGLVAAAGTLTPAILGFGLTDWISRQIVLMDHSDALRKISARLSVSLTAHLFFQPVIWTVNFALGSPVPASWIWLISPIILLEHLASDAHDLLVARGHIVLISTLQFMRATSWPIAVVGVGFLDPATRTLEYVFLGWLVGLTLMALILGGWLLLQRAWSFLRWREFLEVIGGIRASFPLYVRDITWAASLFIDRYLISLTLGLELTGVYVFFWSVANVVHGMVVSVVLQPQVSKLVEAVARADIPNFRAFERKLRWEGTIWTVLLSLAALGAVIVLLPFLQRPELGAHFSIFLLILVAAWARVEADEFGFVLLALHRDRAILMTSAAGAFASALMNAVLVPAFGLWGAAAAFLLTGLVVLALGFRMSRYPKADRAAVQL